MTDSQSYHYNEQHWAKLLSRFLIQQVAKVWKQRWSHTNEAHTSTAALHERQRLQAEVTRLYEMQPQCIIQHAFEVPLQDRQMHYSDTLFAWLTRRGAKKEHCINAIFAVFYTDKQPFFITNLVLGSHLFQRCRRGF
ncbi:hypothetical protein FisN_9Hu182 [Fistulifera solaris]|uniref:Uncharacterized protein n=1 Tax=Fistulifera solaris TaxID=1519565 RepID=A0A1Z5JB20_FISSO|nr:hypothetical protein FisN_9Hu182 [Fistulifera solaris]|eukprot:GAX11092.1 hypothetical protein FisN_9Hu182 [Fistulifera solaris]